MSSEDRSLIAITGANGTIGYASVVYALEKGYRVRCIVRRDAVIHTIKNGPAVQPHLDRLEFSVVPDNTISGAYDAAFRGARYVVHIAGVWPKPNYHPDNEIYYPFVRSMENVLEAAEKADTVNRIVFTQAGAALVNPDDGDTLGTKMENLLNESVQVNPVAASFKPPLPSPHHAYCGAKAYCMTRLKELQATHEKPFSIVQIIPGTVIGPSELVTSTSKAKEQMDRMSKALLFDGPKPRYGFGFVHVEDCARVHIEALNEKIPENCLPDWFVAASTSDQGKDGEAVWKAVGDMIALTFSSEIEQGLFSIGRDKIPINMPYRVDSTMTERMLLDGKPFRNLGQCVEAVGRWYLGLVRGEKH